MPPLARYRPLGTFRFLLSIMVVLQHYQHLLPQAQRAGFSRTGSGAIAVAVFFAISGFIVAEALATFYAGRPGAFLANRLLRLAPPYFAALGVSVLVHAALWHTQRLVLWDYTLQGSPLAPARLLSGALALVPGFNPRWLGQDFEFVPYVWSLRLEMAFYLAAAAVMWVSWRRKAVWPVVGALAASLAASLAFLLLAHRPGALSTAPMFLIGVGFFLHAHHPGRASLALLVLSLAIGALGFVSWRQHGAPFLALQLPILAALLTLFAYLRNAPVGGPAKSLDRRLGELSYPLYLNHYAVGIAASSMLTAGWLLFSGAILLAIILAWACERSVEEPLRALRARIRGRAVDGE